MSTIFSQIRKLQKSGLSKQIVVEFSPQVFTIYKKIHPRNKQLSRARFVLMNDETGMLVMTSRLGLKHFYASDLLLVTRENVDEDAEISMDDALKLNGAQRTSYDLRY
jgi:hypothetical protein